MRKNIFEGRFGKASPERKREGCEKKSSEGNPGNETEVWNKKTKNQKESTESEEGKKVTTVGRFLVSGSFSAENLIEDMGENEGGPGQEKDLQRFFRGRSGIKESGLNGIRNRDRIGWSRRKQQVNN